MSDVDAAAAARAAAEQNLADADRRAAAEQADVTQAQQRAQAAQAAADANPTPANIEAAAQAARELNEQVQQQQAAVEARNQALAAANDARLAEVQAMVSAGNARMLRSRGNPNGIQIGTDLNFEQVTGGNLLRLITNNATVRVTGAEKKVSMGVSLGFIGGAKNEVVLACKNSLIVPYEGKTVTGANRNNFLGLKMDTIGGAKIDKVYGVKREFHAGPKVSIGPAASTKHPIKDLLVGTGQALVGAIKNIGKKGEYTDGKKHLRASKVLRNVDSLKATMTSYSMQATSEKGKFDTMEVRAGTLEIKSTGTFEYRSTGSISLDGGGAKLELGGSAELSKGGSVKASGGGVDVNGKTLVN